MAANEARCDALGANCMCSEPLNTSIYAQDTTSYFNPADTIVSDKQCVRATGLPGTALEDGAGFRYVVETAGEMLAALPSGHLPGLKVLRTKTTAEGNTSGGGQFIGHTFSASDPTARRSFRFYMYWSPTYELENVACVNSSKILEFGTMPSLAAVLSGNGNYDLYGWTGWMKDPLDCCIRGPSESTTWGTYTEPAIRGKWFRFELVATNVTSTGPTTNLTIYMKNITDNLPEVTLIDTTVPTTQPNGLQWDSILATTLKPASGNSINEMFINAFRNGTCGGYKGFSHLLAAAWDTDAGQRIGAACEVEGGCGGTPAPTPDTSTPTTPSSLTATAVSTTQINLSWSASTDNVGVTGYKIYRNGTQIATVAGTSYSNTALTPSTLYSYTISAYDASGNTSVQSASASATTQATPVVSTTPVGSWSFDTTDLTTTTAIDRSGLNNTLTLTSAPARITGKVNQALSFDGIASTASCTDASCGGTTKLDMGTSDWTVSAWVKTTATGNIVTKSGFICGGNPDGWTVYISGTGTLQVGLNDSAAGCVFSPSDGAIINNGSWHHVTAVFNRAGNVVRYVDGIQTGTTASIASLSGVSIDSSAGFRIGSRDATGDSGFLNGAIDEVKVYPRALSLSEIQALSAAGTPAPDTTTPSVSLTAPASGATVSGATVTVSATASDNTGVSGVQFLLDGIALAAEDTTSPYTVTWNTTSSTNGTHTLTATARDAAGNTTTATGVTVTVSNTVSSSATCEAATGSKCYYVSNKTGSGTGTFSNPYGMADLPRSDTPSCSLSSPAIEPLVAGDVLYFRGGNYSFTTCGTADYWATGYIRPARSGVAGKPITFKAYPSETVQVQVGSGTQPAFGTVGLSYIRFQGFTLLGGFGMITGRNNEVSYNEIIGSFVNNVFNHDGIAIGITGDVTDAPWIHHNIIHGVTGLSENSAGLKFYSTTNAIVEDNYIHDNTSGIFDKESGNANTYRRNYLTANQKAQFYGNNQGAPMLVYIYDNVIDGGIDLHSLSNGSQIHDNLIRGNKLASSWLGEVWNSNLWNNIVVSKSTGITAYEEDVSSFVNVEPNPHLRYMNYNLYDATPSYSFGKYSTIPQLFAMSDMRNRGFEQNSSVATNSQIFVDEISYNLQNAWKTSGRYGDAYGPDNIAQIINPN
ncbi:MAG: LamG-like jellyroll fold domain-containing protein, partial [bacterium]|nr:LamG-like jellyroll fold domain-containing protein [bacterium]